MPTSYIPATAAERQEMLRALGRASMDELLPIPPAVRLARPLDLPAGLSEPEAAAKLAALAAKNTVYRRIFRGAGAYAHFIPAVVKSIAGREEFVTAYTPYQAELSQGVLQAIFEYQTNICELCGMDVSNASVYDGASAAAEAVMMCVDRKRSKAVFSAGVHPHTRQAAGAYAAPRGVAIADCPLAGGAADPAEIEALAADAACVVVQNPNCCGVLEDVAALAEAAHRAGAKLIVSCNPHTLGLLESPGALGADIAVGDGQPLGLPLSFGGPYVGFMACRAELARKLPGRIVGETRDAQGRRAFVLTLQAREQHIRREKAASSICSNQALCALTASIYLSAVGPEGLREAAELSCRNAHYLAAELEKLGFEPVYDRPFFHEFLTTCPTDAAALQRALDAKGILGGLPTPEGLLWCATELCGKEAVDELAAALKEVLK